MSFLHRLEDAVVPTARNSYRPHLLGKHALAFFLAAALVAEAYFVAAIFGANPVQPFLAAAGAAAPAYTADWVLIALAFVLGLALVATVVRYAHIQATDLVLQGGVILGIVLLLLALNAWYGGTYG